jgi:predicted MPP superfamily phosphohydrolase
MRWMFWLIVLGMPTMTLVWWAWADARLRGLRAGGWRRLSRLAAAGFTLAFVVGYVGFLAARWGGWHVGTFPGPWWTAGVMVWGLVVLPTVALPVMAASGAWSAVRAARGGVRREPVCEQVTGVDDVTLSRRQVLGAAVALAPMVLSLGATTVSIPQKRRFRVRHLELDMPGLPEALDRMTIAHVTDTHVGKFTHGEVLDRIADATLALDADLTLFTGDLIDFSLADLPEALAMVKRMQRLGSFFMVEGNHDLFEGRDAFEHGVRSQDIPLLLDETAMAYVRGRPVQLMGLRWHGRGAEATIDDHVRRAAVMRDPDAFAILLAHHPHAFDAAVDHRLPLTLAGHTHGGQLMLTPEVGAGPMMFRYWSGLYRRGDARLAVSNGAGNWFPLRTNAPAEILHLTLRSV